MSSLIIILIVCAASVIIIVDVYTSYNRKWGENE